MSQPIKIGDKEYPFATLNSTSGYCWDGRAFPYLSGEDARCLPDTANPSFQWGFSTMIVAIFLIVNLVWSIAMYVIWQDAQFGSHLVKGGFRITQLSAAFLLEHAARQSTGLADEELIHTRRKDLDRKLYGSKKRRGAMIDKDLIWTDGFELRRRDTRDKNELPSKRVSTSSLDTAV
jgi:hypothetical protein